MSVAHGAHSAGLTGQPSQLGALGPWVSEVSWRVSGQVRATWRDRSAPATGATPVTQHTAAPRRSWPEKRYGGPFGACLGSFDRAFNATSIYGGGAAVNGRKLRRRAAEQTPEFGPRANCG